MSSLTLIETLETELNELKTKRKSLELDVLTLEEKISIINEKLKQSNGNKKMQSLKEFLQIEKSRIQKNKLSRVDLHLKELEQKITSIRSSQSSSNYDIGSNKSSNEEFIMSSTDFIHRYQSEQNPQHDIDKNERKYQSTPPLSRPHTSSDSKHYCAYCRENLVQKVPSRKSSVPSISTIDHSKLSISHLPLCMSMDICKDCNALHEFFEKRKIDANENNKPEEMNNDTLKFREMIKTCDSVDMCEDCARLQAQEIENQTIGMSQNDEISMEEFENASIPESILATCESFVVCKCCNHNLSKVNMPTPSSSIVATVCTSHENCTKCAQVLETSRRNSLEVSNKATYEKKFDNLLNFSVSSSTFNRMPEDLTMYHPRKKLYDEIKKQIELQSRVIYDTEVELSKHQVMQESDEKLFRLKQLLEMENIKLQDMIKAAKSEEKRPKNDIWWDKPLQKFLGID